MQRHQAAFLSVIEGGILWAYLGEGEPPAFPGSTASSRLTATFAFEGHINCNWLQALEVGIDPAHASFLHRFFEDSEDTSGAYSRRFRGRFRRIRHADDEDSAQSTTIRSSMSNTPNTACA